MKYSLMPMFIISEFVLSSKAVLKTAMKKGSLLESYCWGCCL